MPARPAPRPNDVQLLPIAPPAAAPRATPLPAPLTADLPEQLLAAYRRQYDPQGPTEEALVEELAHRVASRQLWDAGSLAVVRQTARGLAELAGHEADDPLVGDALLAGALSADVVHRCAQQSLGHSRAFYRVLAKLEETQARRQASAALAQCPPPFPFADEAACEAYLRARLERGASRCPRCQSPAGYYVAPRRAWECAGCGHQRGLRHGTVMARSAVALLIWFDCVRWLLWRPALPARELAEHAQLGRLATARTIADRIRQALASPAASQQLAELDVHFARRSVLSQAAAVTAAAAGPASAPRQYETPHSPPI